MVWVKIRGEAVQRRSRYLTYLCSSFSQASRLRRYQHNLKLDLRNIANTFFRVLENSKRLSEQKPNFKYLAFFPSSSAMAFVSLIMGTICKRSSCKSTSSEIEKDNCHFHRRLQHGRAPKWQQREACVSLFCQLREKSQVWFFRFFFQA